MQNSKKLLEICVDFKFGIGALALCLMFASPMIAANAAVQEDQVGDTQLGRIYYEDKCSQCHGEYSFDEPAPMLDGVIGRTAGTRADFALYSPAMKGSAMVWDDTSLDRFLADPRATIPGTLMKTKIDDPLDRGDVIAYLKTMKATK